MVRVSLVVNIPATCDDHEVVAVIDHELFVGMHCEVCDETFAAYEDPCPACAYDVEHHDYTCTEHK